MFHNLYVSKTLSVTGMPGKHMTPALGELLEYGIDKKVIVGLFKFEVLSGWDEPPPQIKFLETQF